MKHFAEKGTSSSKKRLIPNEQIPSGNKRSKRSVECSITPGGSTPTGAQDLPLDSPAGNLDPDADVGHPIHFPNDLKKLELKMASVKQLTYSDHTYTQKLIDIQKEASA